MHRYPVFITLVSLMLLESALAECNLDELIGFTLIDEKTVEGYIDDDGVFQDDYEGCEWGRVIAFTDGTGVTCSEYSYSYAYRPRAYIFVSGSLVKLCINDDLLDARRLR